MLARHWRAALSLIERAGFFDEMARKISQSRSGNPEERVEDLTAGGGWLLSTDDGLEEDVR
jgi:hypothetical protein